MSGKRLIKLMLVALALVYQVVPLAGQCQTRKLPKAGFQRFSGSMPASNFGGGDVGSLTGTGLSTPGLHLTQGEERTARNIKEPYNPGEPTLNMDWMRWPRQKMPLKVWISPGLMLPKDPFNTLPQSRVPLVFEMLKQPVEYPFSDLPVAPGWTEQCNYQVAAGIEQWRQFQSEGLISFGFTTNPRDAHIMVFFNDQFQDSAGPGGTNVGALTCAQAFTPQQLQDPRYRQTPVIMEFSTQVNQLPERMQANACHEFGHALGIKAHSPYRNDVMHENNVVFTLSEGDKATIRLLYRAEPKYFL